MELSSEWKTLFPISSVFKPPLLLTESDSDSKPILGPLFFNPEPKTLSLLFTSPSLPNHAAPPFLQTQTHNLLSSLRLPLSNSLLLFFPTGPNSDRLGFLLLSIKASRFHAWGAKDDDVLHETTGFEYRILRIAVNPNPNPFPGKLESQSYCASWKLKELHTERFHFKDNSLYIMDDEEYKFPRRFKYVKLDKLSAYLNGSLTEVLVSKLKKPCKGPREKESFSSESHEILCEKLKACGLGRLRSPPAVSVVFKDISSPASIHEVALRRLWAGLPMELLQLAYSNYSEFLEVLLDQKKVSLEFLVVPDLPQLPPFFLRRPSCRSNKWSHKVQRDDALVGPVLPLPILLTLHEYRNGHSESEEEAGVFSLEREISLQCDEIKQVASEMASSDSSCELHGDQAVSLADEREDMWGSSQQPKPFCLYHPVAFKCSTMDHIQDNVFKDEKFDNLIFNVPEKKHVPNGLVETVGPELFDDLCPADLRFDTSAKNFGPNELKIYKVLKKKWSKWQDGFNLYQQFCTESKFQKQSA